MMKDEEAWRIFCLGSDISMIPKPDEELNNDEEGLEDIEDGSGLFEVADELEEGEEHLIEENPAEVSGNAVSTTATKWTGLTKFEPTTSLLLQFDQVMTQRVLTYHISWLEDSLSMTRSQAQWLYALLTRLEKPIHRDTESLIRQLYRRCCQLRKDLSLRQSAMDMVSEADRLGLDQSVAELNMMIAITGKYFGQGEHDRSIYVQTSIAGLDTDHEEADEEEEDDDTDQMLEEGELAEEEDINYNPQRKRYR
jgi:hypothetical protein